MKRRGFLLTLAGAAVAPAVPAAEPLLRGRLPRRPQSLGALYVGGTHVGAVSFIEIRAKDGGLLCRIGSDQGFIGAWFEPLPLRFPELAQRVEG